MCKPGFIETGLKCIKEISTTDMENVNDYSSSSTFITLIDENTAKNKLFSLSSNNNTINEITENSNAILKPNTTTPQFTLGKETSSTYFTLSGYISNTTTSGNQIISKPVTTNSTGTTNIVKFFSV